MKTPWNTSGVPRGRGIYARIFFSWWWLGGGAQQIQLGTEGRENWDLEAVAL
jgi:hypothetical protein